MSVVQNIKIMLSDGLYQYIRDFWWKRCCDCCSLLIWIYSILWHKCVQKLSNRSIHLFRLLSSAVASPKFNGEPKTFWEGKVFDFRR